MRSQFYRPEIDGLRALAVLPVVFYHLGWGLFSGGYVGVDSFFVVSGYLITQIIMRHIGEDAFSIALFYERRARRIAPARTGVRHALALLGLSLVGWAVFSFTPETRFPGVAALAPCLGAGLIIHASSHDDRGVGRLLSWRPLVAVGLISYSLYLWHWPLIVFAKYYLVRPLQGSEIVLLLAVSLALASASWRWVEQPFRKSNGVFGQTRLFFATAVAGNPD